MQDKEKLLDDILNQYSVKKTDEDNNEKETSDIKDKIDGWLNINKNKQTTADDSLGEQALPETKDCAEENKYIKPYLKEEGPLSPVDKEQQEIAEKKETIKEIPVELEIAKPEKAYDIKNEDVPVIVENISNINDIEENYHKARLDKFFEGYETDGNDSKINNIGNDKKIGDIFGKLMDEDDDTEPPVGEKPLPEEELEDYTSEEDKEAVIKELLHVKRTATLKTVVCGVIAIIITYINLGAMYPALIPSGISPANNLFTFSIINALLLFVMILIGIGTFSEGISGIFTFKANNDTLPAVATLLSIIQSFYMSFMKPGSLSTFTTVYFGIAALSFFFCILSKYLHNAAVLKNFEVVSSENGLLTVVKPHIKNLPADMQDDSDDILEIVNVKFIKSFLDKSYKDNSSEYNKKIVPFALIMIIVIGFLGYLNAVEMQLLPIYAFISAITCAAAAASVFMGALTYSLPYFATSGKTVKKGGAIIGFNPKVSFSSVLAYVMRDDIFFSGKECSISGMKIMDNSDISEVISKVASVLKETGGPLSHSFLSVLDNNHTDLKKVENIQISEARGISADIDGEKIFFGNTQYLRSCEIDVGIDNYEAELSKRGKHILLFAQNGLLKAIFAVDYGVAVPEREALEISEKNGLIIFIYTTDYNVNKALVRAKTGMNDPDVHVIGSSAAPDIAKDLFVREKMIAEVVSDNGFLGVLSAVSAHKSLKRSFKLLTVLKFVSIFLALILTGYMVFSKTPVNFDQLLIYQMIWALLSAIISFL